MIRYTSENKELIFNDARQKATDALEKTLDDLYGKAEVSERQFAGSWLHEMSENRDIYPGGWYCPPPSGIAVLTGERLKFDSLRNEEYWPSDERFIDWKNGLLYAYCSPVSKKTGRMGDMSVTLYFGKDEKIRKHFRNCRAAAEEIFAHLEDSTGPGELFRYAQEVFRKRGLLSNVISRTDSLPSNLGHTFCRLDRFENDLTLTQEEIRFLSSSRKFLNEGADFGFEDGLQFTVEPQLLSMEDPTLPKVSHHFLVKKTKEGFIVCNDIDRLLKRFGLI